MNGRLRYLRRLIPIHIPSPAAPAGKNARLISGAGPVSYSSSDEAEERGLFEWNEMIRERSHCAAALVYAEMISVGQSPDCYTFPFLLKSCKDFSLGNQIHAHMIVFGHGMNGFCKNAILAMYMKCGRCDVAAQVFDHMPVYQRTVVSWNTMISGFSYNGCEKRALAVFKDMVLEGIELNSATLVSVLPVCASLGDEKSGRMVHRYAKVTGLDGLVQVRNALVDMYAKHGRLMDAREVFEEGEKDVISWTAMLGGYVLNGEESEVLLLGRRMLHTSDIKPNSVTLAILLSACPSWSSAVGYGKCIHAAAIRRQERFHLDVIVETALINMYAKCGSVECGHRLLKTTSRKTSAWNALMTGYTQNAMAIEAIKLFKQMKSECVPCDKTTIICILSAYTLLSDMQHANCIHGQLICSGFYVLDGSVEIATALVNIYCRSGSLDSARLVFDALSCKDMIAWTAIKTGYGMHGQGEEALILFKQMLQAGMEPNEITFTSTFYACSHAGLVDEGLHLFKSINQYGIQPHVDHFASLVDLLGQAGRLDEAYEIIMATPFEASHAAWGALLAACTVHENVELGEVAGWQMLRIEPGNTGNYVLIANLYSTAGRWNDALEIRKKMDERRLMKTPARSLA